MPISNTEPAVQVCTPADVERIAAGTEPVLRNLQITQCYCELSAAFAARTGIVANWCTFATWASKQAGQTIRREDLKRTLEACLQQDVETREMLTLIGTLVNELAPAISLTTIRESIIARYLADTASKAADAVSRGNKKVFEEIARQFALFLQTCCADTVSTPAHLEQFCSLLRSGPPPEGQEYLRHAFRHYYAAFFEQDEKKKAELCLMANLEIGFHEQTRLQPEIAEALNAGMIDTRVFWQQLQRLVLKKANIWGKLVLFVKHWLGKTALLDNTVKALADKLQLQVRRLLTAHLMTLALPTGRLQLGKDLLSVFPLRLRSLQNAELLVFLTGVDATPDSVSQSGATDWANLPERLHFIADLFRCYQEEPSLFSAAFTAEQIAAIRINTIPAGDL